MKEESIEPLISLVNKLLERINENEASLSKLVYKIDSLGFPDSLDKSVIGYEIDKSNILVERHLELKFSISDVKVSKEFEQGLQGIRNERIKKLLIENEKLKLLEATKKRRNNELYQVVQVYASFIAEKLLPMIRNDIQAYSEKVIDESKMTTVPYKFKESDRLWEHYIKYIEELVEMSNVCNKMGQVIAKMHNINELGEITEKLATIRCFCDQVHGTLAGQLDKNFQ